MNLDKPNIAWIYAWAVLHILSVLLALTVIPNRIGVFPLKHLIVAVASLCVFHSVASYGLLAAANCAIDRLLSISIASTAAIVCIAAVPTEPRIAQSLAAVVFIAIVCWQATLKVLEE